MNNTNTSLISDEMHFKNSTLASPSNSNIKSILKTSQMSSSKTKTEFNSSDGAETAKTSSQKPASSTLESTLRAVDPNASRHAYRQPDVGGAADLHTSPEPLPSYFDETVQKNGSLASRLRTTLAHVKWAPESEYSILSHPKQPNVRLPLPQYSMSILVVPMLGSSAVFMIYLFVKPYLGFLASLFVLMVCMAWLMNALASRRKVIVPFPTHLTPPVDKAHSTPQTVNNVKATPTLAVKKQ